jgi:hypothetical protein
MTADQNNSKEPNFSGWDTAYTAASGVGAYVRYKNGDMAGAVTLAFAFASYSAGWLSRHQTSLSAKFKAAGFMGLIVTMAMGFLNFQDNDSESATAPTNVSAPDALPE